MDRLTGKVAIITGGSRGIGRAVALAFAEEGAAVAITGMRDERALHAVEKEIASKGQRVVAAISDVTQRTQVDAFIERVKKKWGRIDILVNNAGIIKPTPLEKISEDQWDSIMAVHLKGTFNCTQAVLRAMKRQKSGKIINVTSPAGLRPETDVSDYAAAKGGIIAFSFNVANELAPHNIQVNCISPVAETRMTHALDAFRKRKSKQNLPPSRRRISPEGVAPAFIFFASTDSDNITGQVLAFHQR